MKTQEKAAGLQQNKTPRHFRAAAKKSVYFRVAGAFFLLIFVGSVLALASLGGMMHHESQQLEELAALVGKSDAADSPASNLGDTADNHTGDSSALSLYETLHQKNGEFWGWLQIPGTRINYPIMHSPSQPEKYLHTGFDNAYSYSGLPFLDAACTPDSDNLLVYGHNMIDGSMFTDLTKYQSKSHWEAHPTLLLETAAGEQEYEIIFAFYDRVYAKDEQVFKFYRFINAADQQDFDYAVANLRAKQLYDTGVEVSYGDQLLTLITCEYHTSNGRFVVVARRA